jgi:hypothetical protein
VRLIDWLLDWFVHSFRGKATYIHLSPISVLPLFCSVFSQKPGRVEYGSMVVPGISHLQHLWGRARSLTLRIIQHTHIMWKKMDSYFAHSPENFTLKFGAFRIRFANSKKLAEPPRFYRHTVRRGILPLTEHHYQNSYSSSSVGSKEIIDTSSETSLNILRSISKLYQNFIRFYYRRTTS